MEREIYVNGVAQRSAAETLQALLLARGLALDAAFACAINNQFVARSQWPQRVLCSGDRIDIIAPITGG